MAKSEDKLREIATVDKYDGTNSHLWKLHMRFIFQSRELYGIVSDEEKKASCITDDAKAKWEKKDKQAIVAILGAIGS